MFSNSIEHTTNKNQILWYGVVSLTRILKLAEFLMKIQSKLLSTWGSPWNQNPLDPLWISYFLLKFRKTIFEMLVWSRKHLSEILKIVYLDGWMHSAYKWSSQNKKCSSQNKKCILICSSKYILLWRAPMKKSDQPTCSSWNSKLIWFAHLVK